MTTTTSHYRLRTRLEDAIATARTSAPHRWSWAGLDVDVWASEAGLALLEVMTPSVVGPDRPEPTPWRLVTIQDADLARELRDHTSTPVTVDGAHGTTGRWGEVVFTSLSLRAWPDGLVVGRHSDTSWWAVLPPGPLAARAPEIALKQVLERALAQRSAVVLHASAAVQPGTDGAVLFMGEAGAGKTTAALTLAAAGGQYLSGDRTVLDLAADGLRAVGSAQSTRLRWGTVDGLGLRGAILAHPPLRHGLDHSPLSEAAGTSLPEKVVLGHRELERLGIATVTQAPARAAVIVEPRRTDEPPSLSPLTTDPAVEVVPHLRNTWLMHHPDASAHLPDRVFLDRVPWFRLRWLPAHDNLIALLSRTPRGLS